MKAGGNALSCVTGGAGRGWGKVLHQRAVSVEQAAQGSGHSPKLLEFKEHLDNTLRCRA